MPIRKGKGPLRYSNPTLSSGGSDCCPGSYTLRRSSPMPLTQSPFLPLLLLLYSSLALLFHYIQTGHHGLRAETKTFKARKGYDCDHPLTGRNFKVVVGHVLCLEGFRIAKAGGRLRWR